MSLASAPCNHGVAYHIPHPLHPPDTTQPHTPTVDQSFTSAPSSRHPAFPLSEVYPVLRLYLDRSSLRLSEPHRRIPTRQTKCAKRRRKQSRRLVLRAFCACAPTSPTHGPWSKHASRAKTMPLDETPSPSRVGCDSKTCANSGQLTKADSTKAGTCCSLHRALAIPRPPCPPCPAAAMLRPWSTRLISDFFARHPALCLARALGALQELDRHNRDWATLAVKRFSWARGASRQKSSVRVSSPAVPLPSLSPRWSAAGRHRNRTSAERAQCANHGSERLRRPACPRHPAIHLLGSLTPLGRRPTDRHLGPGKSFHLPHSCPDRAPHLSGPVQLAADHSLRGLALFSNGLMPRDSRGYSVHSLLLAS